MTGPSLLEQVNTSYFSSLPYTIQDMVIELGGEFCTPDTRSSLVVTDRKLVSAANDKSTVLGGISLCYLINEAD